MLVKIIGPDVAQLISAARREKQLTQAELSEKSRVSVRTIQDLEHGRRDSFSEVTMIHLCRVLDLDVRQILGEREYLSRKRRAIRIRIWLIAIVVLFGIGGMVTLGHLSRISNAKRLFTMPGEKLTIQSTTPDWGDREGIIVNYVKFDRSAVCGEIVPIKIKWSYHYAEANYFAYYACAFAEWDPQNKIRIYDGIMFREGSQVRDFKVRCPDKTGKYRVRIFFTPSNAPVSNFDGYDAINPPSGAKLAKYLETTINVASE